MLQPMCFVRFTDSMTCSQLQDCVGCHVLLIVVAACREALKMLDKGGAAGKMVLIVEEAA